MGDLVRLQGDVELSEDQSADVGERGQQMPAPVPAGGRAAYGFTVDGDHLEFLRIHLPQRDPGAEDEIQAVAVEFGYGASEGGFAGRVAGDAEFRQSHWGGRGGPFGDGHEGAGAGDDRARRDRQNPGQSVPHSPRFAGIGHCVQRGQ